MQRFIVIFLAAFVSVWSMIPAAHAFSVKSCSQTERPNILAASTFIDANLNTIVGMMTSLDAGDRAEFLTKWPRVKIKCRDRGMCRGTGFFGHASGGPGNTVKICYSNMVDFTGQSLCNLVEVIVHEFGHANGYAIFSDHNNPSPSTQVNDPVYRIGIAARQFCEARAAAGQFTDAPLTGTTRAKIGQSCSSNSACNTGKCQGGQCVCGTSSHCNNPNFTCVKRTTRMNLCAPLNQPRGAYCYRDRQCASGKCKSGGLGNPFCK